MRACIRLGAVFFSLLLVVSCGLWDSLFGEKIDCQPLPVPVLSSVSKAEAGGFHAQAVQVLSYLYGWGHNIHGQIGKATTADNQYLPLEIGTDDDWAAVSAGALHTLALRNDGSLWAWGCNQRGQLGTGRSGTSEQEESPVKIGSETWQLISAGGEHSVGIRSDGSLWTWGYNGSGQLGQGSFGDEASELLPKRVGLASDWIAVSAGDHHTLAMREDGSLWAWGNNEYGQLGNGKSGYTTAGIVEMETSPVPITLPGKPWHTIPPVFAAGGYHSGALASDGTLYLWGRNESGQLGQAVSSSLLAEPTPLMRPSGMAAGAAWSALALGTLHSAALSDDQSLWLWGDNYYGQCGNGVYGDGKYLAAPTRIGTERYWKQVSLGVHFSLGLAEDGTAYAWGADEMGQLGQGAD